MGARRFWGARRRFALSIFVLFILVVVVLSAVARIYYLHEAATIRRDQLENLAVIAELKCRELSAWRHERLIDARLHANGLFLRDAIVRYVRGKRIDGGLEERIRTRLTHILEITQYEDVILATRDGQVLLGFDPRHSTLESESQRLIEECVNREIPVIGDFFRDDRECTGVHLDVAAPILDEGRVPVAVLLFRTDPDLYLYPLLARWPGRSRTAETLLVRRQGDSAVILNPLRHVAALPLTLEVPLDRTERMAVRAVLGAQGEVTGTDYRGVDVLGVLRAIPESHWSMVAKMDTAEALSEVRYRSLAVGMVLALSILLSAGLAGLAFSVKQRRIAHELLESEERRRTAAESNLEALNALAQSRARHESTLDSLMEGVQVLDREWRYIYVNEACVRHARKARQELLGKRMNEVYPGIEDTDVFALMKRCMERREIGRMESEFRYPDGEVLWYEIGVQPVEEGICVLSIEITDRKRAERERERLSEQLIQAQKLEAVGRLAGGVAHDFNNTLQVIRGHVELAIEDAPPGAGIREDLQEIAAAADRSAGLTRQLLAFARKQTIAPRILDLNDVIAGMLKMIRRLIGEDIELDWRPGTGLPRVRMDPSQIDQVLANLLVNARDAIPGKGRVTVETTVVSVDEGYAGERIEVAPGPYVMVAVTDTGVGMDRETQARIFEPFFTTKPPGLGTGLGLATVHGIVKQNGGFLSVYSEPERGTTFKIYLPVHEESEDEAAVTVSGAYPPSSPDGVGGSKPDRGTETILMTEDDASIRKVGRVLLERLGYTVLEASNPTEAIGLAERHGAGIHLLLTDVVMPGMSGKELRDRVTGLHPRIRTIFMSGYTANVIVHHGVLEPGIHFLQKPFSARDLGRKIRAVLDA